MIPVIRVAILTGLLATTSFTPGIEGAPRLRDLAGEEADFRGCGREPVSTIDVAGEYTVTSTTVLMPGTEGALRVIEFTAKDEEESEKGAP